MPKLGPPRKVGPAEPAPKSPVADAKADAPWEKSSAKIGPPAKKDAPLTDETKTAPPLSTKQAYTPRGDDASPAKKVPSKTPTVKEKEAKTEMPKKAAQSLKQETPGKIPPKLLPKCDEATRSLPKKAPIGKATPEALPEEGDTNTPPSKKPPLSKASPKVLPDGGETPFGKTIPEVVPGVKDTKISPPKKAPFGKAIPETLPEGKDIQKSPPKKALGKAAAGGLPDGGDTNKAPPKPSTGSEPKEAKKVPETKDSKKPPPLKKAAPPKASLDTLPKEAKKPPLKKSPPVKTTPDVGEAKKNPVPNETPVLNETAPGDIAAGLPKIEHGDSKKAPTVKKAIPPPTKGAPKAQPKVESAKKSPLSEKAEQKIPNLSVKSPPSADETTKNPLPTKQALFPKKGGSQPTNDDDSCQTKKPPLKKAVPSPKAKIIGESVEQTQSRESMPLPKAEGVEGVIDDGAKKPSPSLKKSGPPVIKETPQLIPEAESPRDGPSKSTKASLKKASIPPKKESFSPLKGAAPKPKPLPETIESSEPPKKTPPLKKPPTKALGKETSPTASALGETENEGPTKAIPGNTPPPPKERVKTPGVQAPVMKVKLPPKKEGLSEGEVKLLEKFEKASAKSLKAKVAAKNTTFVLGQKSASARVSAKKNAEAFIEGMS
eukprot:GHVN01002295.1.p1 GENE.GHVN01002295.1~~GHVN01002295.1.p1  ORF type:complete len:660 (+),score=132.59 GHVN01002295.1:1419-3398(+)